MSAHTTTYIPQQTTMTTTSVPAGSVSGQPHVIQVPVPAAQPAPVFIMQAPPQPQPVYTQPAPPLQQPQQPMQPIHIEINNTTAPPAAAGAGMTINNTTEAAAVPAPQHM